MPTTPITILLVDDDPGVRRFVSRILTDANYRVIEAGDGEEAMQIAAKHEGVIHLLLTDIMMPRLNGLELAQKISMQTPTIRVLFISGHIESDLVSSALGGRPLLKKPFTPEGLLLAVQAVLALGDS